MHPLCRLLAVLCSIISLLKIVSYPFDLTGINISPNWHWYCTYTVLVIACQVLTDSEPSVTVHWINMRCGYDYTMCLCVSVCVCVCVCTEYWILHILGIKVWLQQLFFLQKRNKYVLSMIEMVSEQHLIKCNFFSWNPTLARIWPEVDTFRMSLCEVSSGSPSLSDDSSPASAWGSGEVRDSRGSRT